MTTEILDTPTVRAALEAFRGGEPDGPAWADDLGAEFIITNES